MDSLFSRITEVGGSRLPLLRWSVVRMALGAKKLLKDWQVGDGREEAVARHVLATARPNSVREAIAAIDDFAYRQKYLINVGDRKGAILDDVIRQVKPQRVLELGSYVGYSALRIARTLPPGGHVYSVEFSPANAAIARRIIAHAGASDRVTIVVGTLGDGGATLAALEQEHGFSRGALDVAFIDHDKDAYLPDLQRILRADWLRPGAVVVADNVKFPGAPAYRAFMEAEEGRLFRTVAHETYAEYQTMITDTVLVSTLIDAQPMLS